ncbi:hypothetical protein E4U41_002264 [Claviceps citrina]|nr:hypothetical protein E4U41_002264 [Claviceps citrina]
MRGKPSFDDRPSPALHNNMADATDWDDVLRKHMRLLKLAGADLNQVDLGNTPIFTEAVRRHVDGRDKAPDQLVFSQHGLLGGDVARLREMRSDDCCPSDGSPLLHFNVTAPSSTFICGSQGSGKSHTLSCLLENCLVASEANTLPRPLTAILFHYDAFSSDADGQPCEAAHLASNPDVSVRVLCAPTNVGQIKSTYRHLKNVHVQELRLSQRSLNTRRMMDLMAVSSTEGGALPLYFHVVTRILKEMRIKQQEQRSAGGGGGHFDYQAFKQALALETMTPGQLAPLTQRLETMESFLAPEHVGKTLATRRMDTATKWEGKPGELTIVDLSCPCVTADSACALFNICLGLFLEQNDSAAPADMTGRVVALDEAHKYMTDSAESRTLTESLLTTIRLQRHLGLRVMIATQEPTLSPRLLDLCSVTIVHRFTSPEWLQSLKRHLAAAAQPSSTAVPSDATQLATLFGRIVGLRQGEALLFCPSALVGVVAVEAEPRDGRDGFADWAAAQDGRRDVVVDGSGNHLVRLGCGVMHIRVRERVTQDGGKSVMAE